MKHAIWAFTVLAAICIICATIISLYLFSVTRQADLILDDYLGLILLIVFLLIGSFLCGICIMASTSIKETITTHTPIKDNEKSD